jgi:hypothetical protein
VVNPQMYFLAHNPLWCILLVCKHVNSNLPQGNPLSSINFPL